MEQDAPQTMGYWSPKKVFLATLIVVAVGLSFWLLVRFRLVLFSFFQALVFSTAISPIVEWLTNKRVPRAVSIAVTYIVIMVLVIGIILMATPLVANQASTVANTLTSYYQDLHTSLLRSSSIFVQRLAGRLPVSLAPLSVAQPQDGNGSFSAINQALGYLGIVGSSLFAVLAVFLLTFYWTLDRERTLRSLLIIAPVERREEIRDLLTATEAKVGSYVRGVAILCTFIGVMALIAYLIIGLPHAFLLGIIAGVLEVVPIVGPALGALPAVVVAISSDPSKIPWVIIAVVVIQFSENHFLVPRVMNKTVGVNPVVSLLAFAAFSSLFGFAGALLAIPMAVLIQIVLDRYVLGTEVVAQPAPMGRDRLSVLRYQAHELVQDVRKQVRVKETDLIEERTDEMEDTIEAIATDLDSILARLDDEDVEGQSK